MASHNKAKTSRSCFPNTPPLRGPGERGSGSSQGAAGRPSAELVLQSLNPAKPRKSGRQLHGGGVKTKRQRKAGVGRGATRRQEGGRNREVRSTSNLPIPRAVCCKAVNQSLLPPHGPCAAHAPAAAMLPLSESRAVPGEVYGTPCPRRCRHGSQPICCLCCWSGCHRRAMAVPVAPSLPRSPGVSACTETIQHGISREMRVFHRRLSSLF